MPEIAGLLGGGDEARVVAGGRDERLPFGRQLGLGAQRRHDRVGHRDRTGIAGLRLHRGHVQGGARGVRGRARSWSRAASAARARRPSSSAGARRDGTRPRRCGARSGRACAAPACSRWPAGPIPAAARRRRTARARRPARSPSRRPRARSASTSGRLLEKTSRPSSGGTWLKTVCVCHGAVLSPVGCETVAMEEVTQMAAPRRPGADCPSSAAAEPEHPPDSIGAAGRSRALSARSAKHRPGALPDAPKSTDTKDRTWQRSRCRTRSSSSTATR